MCGSLLGKSLVQTLRSMSSISVSKGSSVISSVLFVAAWFPEGRKRLCWIYNIISLSLTEQVIQVDVIRRRPAKFIKCPGSKGWTAFYLCAWNYCCEMNQHENKESEGRWKWWEKSKYLYVYKGEEERCKRGVQRNLKSLQTLLNTQVVYEHLPSSLAFLWNSKPGCPQWPLMHSVYLLQPSLAIMHNVLKKKF